MARWKANGRLSIHVNWTFFAIYYGSSYEAKCVQLGCFHRGRPLCTQILPGDGRPPSTIFGVRKLETLGYPMVKTTSLCVPSFWHNTEVCRTDGYAVAYTELAKLALRHAVKTNQSLKSVTVNECSSLFRTRGNEQNNLVPA